MAVKTKATQLGEYVCKIGNYDIRHVIVMPATKKTFLGKIVKNEGSVTAGAYIGRKLVKGGFNDHSKAIQYAWGRLKNDNLQHTVSKRSIKKYNLN
jgi:hypothetical protein